MIPRWPLRPRTIGSEALATSRVIGDGRRLDVERSAHRPREDRDRHEVEHDRGHDLVGAPRGFEEARDEAPDRAGHHPGEEGERDRDQRRGFAQLDADRDRPERPHQELALGTDVEQPGLERQPDRQAAQDERDRVDERVDDRVEVPDRAVDERDVRRDREAGLQLLRDEPLRDDDDDRTDEDGQPDRQDRQEPRPPTTARTLVTPRPPRGQRRRFPARRSPSGRRPRSCRRSGCRGRPRCARHT